MKIQLHSDLHLEFYDETLFNGESADTLILAGDIGVFYKKNQLTRYTDFLKSCSVLYKHVILITGNHEYYRSSIETINHTIKEIISENNLDNVHFLDDEYVDIDNVRFFGTTLWTNYQRGGMTDTIAKELGASRMNDHHLIMANNQLFTVDNAIDKCNHSLKCIEESKPSDDMHYVVVTHHAPTYESVSNLFKGNSMNACFVNDLDDFIGKVKPVVWCHGHVHSQHDYKVHDTRVLCNAKGYPNEKECVYDVNCLFELL